MAGKQEGRGQGLMGAAEVEPATFIHLSETQRERIAKLHEDIDRLGDGNSFLEKEEIEAIAKNVAKKFTEMDSASTGHVTVEGLLAFFDNLKSKRGERKVEGMLVGDVHCGCLRRDAH